MKKIMRSPVVTGLMFILAAALLVVGSIGSTQAALQVRSRNYYSAFDLDHIGVTLLENGTAVAFRNYGSTAASGFTEVQGGNLVLNSLGTDKDFKIGKQYPFEITAQNTGTIDQYLRVTIHKYWMQSVTASGAKGWFHGENGSKIIDNIYKPEYIELGYKGGTKNYNSENWIQDTSSSTAEREIYYYKGILKPGAATAPLFSNLSISKTMSKDCVVTTVGNKTIYTYAYDGYAFVVEAEVDAVQTHHARAAINSAWGANGTVLTAMGIPNE